LLYTTYIFNVYLHLALLASRSWRRIRTIWGYITYKQHQCDYFNTVREEDSTGVTRLHQGSGTCAIRFGYFGSRKWAGTCGRSTTRKCGKSNNCLKCSLWKSFFLFITHISIRFL